MVTISTCGVRALSNAAPALSILSAQHRIGHTCTCAPAGGASYLQAPDLKQQVRACAPLQSCAHPLRRAPLPVRLSTAPPDGARRTSQSPRPLTPKAPRVPPAPPPPSPPTRPSPRSMQCSSTIPFPCGRFAALSLALHPYGAERSPGARAPKLRATRQESTCRRTESSGAPL